ncbi:kinase-like domain-containing protein [Ilyonectria sp. MPI-CAGE-AT-0026]|nr:kinase-like domain-containing protein [Ilyonectria sp. MPI-CAGE-AT-0026]
MADMDANDTESNNLAAKTANANLWTSDDEDQAEVRNRDFAPGPYSRGALLGSGGWCVAYKVRRLRDGGVFAGKTSKFPGQLQKELAILPSLSHNHIVKYIDWYEDKASPLGTLLVTELCLGGTLQDRINYSPNGTGLKETLQVIVQSAKALEYLHGKGLMHTDVKPRNILIRTWNPVDIVLADCADVKPATFTGRAVGTEAYWSPGIARYKRHTGISDDVWALGVTLLGMMSQWPKLRTTDDLKRYPTICYEHTQTLKELNPTNGIVQLASKMLAWERAKRFTAAECVAFATQMLAENTGSNEFGFKSPKDFSSIVFW